MLLLEAFKGSLSPLAAKTAPTGGEESDKTRLSETGAQRRKRVVDGTISACSHLSEPARGRRWSGIQGQTSDMA